jgi:hypothetical protein
VTGSDQVWNPGHPHNVLEVFFCTFAPKEKRIAYSPSFGLTVIPSKLQKYYQAWLIDLAYCSVREPSGAKLIKDLTGREVPVLVDPTLLLSAEEWAILSSPVTAKKYILLYYLGKVPDHVMDLAKELSLKHDLEIIQIFNKDIEETYHHGVEDFISYFKSASLVLTDSFHGTVFSIIFSVPFLVSRRVGEGIYAQMYTRLENLLELFNFNIRTIENLHLIHNIFDQDFSHSKEILEIQKGIALTYLKEALNIQESESNV